MATKRRPTKSTTTRPTKRRKSSSSRSRGKRKGLLPFLRRHPVAPTLLVGAVLGRVAENAGTVVPSLAGKLAALGVAVTPEHQDLAVSVLTVGGLW